MPLQLGHGRGPFEPLNFPLGRPGIAPVAPVGLIIDENCEGAGSPAGWTTTHGTPDWDYTAAPLEGAQSLYLPLSTAATRTSYDFGDRYEFWFYCRFKLTNGSVPAAALTFIGFTRSGLATTTFGLFLTTANKLRFGNGPTIFTNALSLDTLYHVWLHFKPGGGANGILDVGYSTDGVRPTSGVNYAEETNWNAILPHGKLWIGNTTTLNEDIIYDKIRVADTPIGDNGELIDYSGDIVTAGAFTGDTTDAFTAADAATRLIVNARDVADATTNADSATRIVINLRTTSDAETVSETPVASRTFPRSATDTATNADAATRLATWLRTVTDAAANSDAATRLVQLARSLSDTATLGDAATRVVSGFRTVTDAAANSDAATRVATWFRSVANATANSDAATRLVQLARSFSNATTLSDVVTRVFSGFRTAADSSTNADAPTRAITNSRTTSDSATAGQVATRLIANLRTVANSTTLSDAVTRVGTFLRALTDTATFAEVATLFGAVMRTAADAFTSSAVVTRLIDLFRSLTDAVSFAESPTSVPQEHLAADIVGVGTMSGTLHVIGGVVPVVVQPPGAGPWPYRRPPIRERLRRAYEKVRIVHRWLECRIRGEFDLTATIQVRLPEPIVVPKPPPPHIRLVWSVQADSEFNAMTPRLQDSFYMDDERDLEDVLHALSQL